LNWAWDQNKDRFNRRKHGLSLATASFVFDDPLALSRADEHRPEERWQTIGRVGPALIFVVHTCPEQIDGEETGRIISARKATAHERRAYEEGEF
jgi:uncharacterized protein